MIIKKQMNKEQALQKLTELENEALNLENETKKLREILHKLYKNYKEKEKLLLSMWDVETSNREIQKKARLDYIEAKALYDYKCLSTVLKVKIKTNE